MNSEKKYPYIGKAGRHEALFTGKDSGIDLSDGEFYTLGFNEYQFTNITHEFLQNTWGVVESKEHAEFIIELARSAGLITSDTWNNTHDYFSINYNGLLFWSGKFHAESRGEKQITIPLPPKSEDSVDKLTPEEEFELHQNQAVQALNSEEEYSKRVIDSGCYNLNCRSELVDVETWPQVGSKVTTYGQQGNVILPADKNGFYIIDASGLYLAAKTTDITKPKSKEDLLIEELQTKLCENNYVDNYTLANDIVNGMIEGLRYEPK